MEKLPVRTFKYMFSKQLSVLSNKLCNCLGRSKGKFTYKVKSI